MPKAAHTSTTSRRRAEDAATIGLMLLKASILGPDHGTTGATLPPRQPAPATGAARVMEMA